MCSKTKINLVANNNRLFFFLDEPAFYPERFQESMHPQDYQPAEGEFFDPHSSAPPPLMEQDSRAQRDARYSNNLDKITSALLELVARK